MPRAPIIPAGGFYKDDVLQWSSQDVVNLLPTRAERPGSRTETILRNAPGLKPYRRIRVDGAPVGRGRGLREVEGKLFAVVGTKLYQVTDKGGFIERGTIPGVRRVSMAHNQFNGGNQLSVVNGYSGYIYDTTSLALAKITDAGYPGGLVTFFVDQYLGYVAPAGDKWGHSDLNQGLDYNTLDTYEAEGLPDKIVTAIITHNQVLVLGKQSGEYYVNNPSGDGTAPFVRAGNMFLEIGCAATFAATKVEGTVVILDHNLSVKALDGYSAVRLSTAAIEQAFSECTPDEIAQAYTFAYEPEGYRIAYFTVPGKFTFGYDFVNKEWHRRASNGLDYWAVSDVVKWQGKWYAQDSRNGDLYELDFKYPREACDELIREYSMPPLHANGKRLIVNEFSPLLSTGAATVPCAEWKVQPLGPTISGSPPTGIVGVDYSGFSPIVAEGGAPIVSVTVVSGSLAPGMAFDGPEILVNAPLKNGVYPITWKVTDANGLYALLTDNIVVECAGGEIGESITATYTLDGYHGTSAIFPLSNGNLGFAASPLALSPGGTYTVGELDSSLSVVSSHSVTWNGFAHGEAELRLRGIDEDGYVISADDAYGLCKLEQSGTEVGRFQPTDTAVTSWWYNESGYAPEGQGLVWFGDAGGGAGSWYLGLRKTDSQERKLYKFPLSAGAPAASEAIVSGVGSATSPYFWMTRSRDGNIHIIGQDGVYTKYDENLLQTESRALGVSVAGLRGFGVDGDVVALVYGAVDSTSRVDFRRIVGGELIRSVLSTNFYGNQSTRVIFTDDSCYIQCRTWVGRIEYSPPTCEITP